MKKSKEEGKWAENMNYKLTAQIDSKVYKQFRIKNIYFSYF